LPRERALLLLHSAHVMQHFRTVTIIDVHALKRERFFSWMVMFVR
jgi:hypothetical protein